MRITVCIDDAELSAVQEITGEKQKSRAISKAVTAFIRQAKTIRFTERAAAGEFDGWFDWNAFAEADRVSLGDAAELQQQLDDLGDR